MFTAKLPTFPCSFRTTTRQRSFERGRLDADQLGNFAAKRVLVDAHSSKHLVGDALAFPEESEEDVFVADVVVPELERFAEAEFENFLRAGVNGIW